MLKNTGERKLPQITDPKPLGVEIDPEKSAEFTKLTINYGVDTVYELWKDPEVTNPTIRQQIILYFTAPDTQKLPFTRPDMWEYDIFRIQEAIDGKNTKSICKRFADRPELVQELAQGFLYWLDTIDGVTDESQYGSYQYYQAAIQLLLPAVDQETADRLFEHHPLKSAEPSHHGSTGYSPLIDFLSDKDIPNKYRNRMLSQWLDIAKQEEQGTIDPRVEHERATDVMAYLTYSGQGGKLNKATITKIVRFLEDTIEPQIPYSRNYDVASVANRITSEKVRFQFAVRHVFGRRARFRIDSERDLEFIKSLGEELQEKGIEEFDKKIEKLVKDYEFKKHEKNAQLAAKSAILARFKEL